MDMVMLLVVVEMGGLQESACRIGTVLGVETFVETWMVDKTLIFCCAVVAFGVNGKGQGGGGTWQWGVRMEGRPRPKSFVAIVEQPGGAGTETNVGSYVVCARWGTAKLCESSNIVTVVGVPTSSPRQLLSKVRLLSRTGDKII